MPFTLDQVVPWGRSFDEYMRMFALSAVDFAGRIAGCADGPASFNAEATALGYCVTSFDPLYRFSEAEIELRIQETYAQVLAQLRVNQEHYRWDFFPTPEIVGEWRMRAMRRFLTDYPPGLRAQRYVDAGLPELPCADNTFALALCSHFLFLYSDHLSLDFHLAAIRELCRVAPEARIFPLLTLAGAPSPHLGPVIAALQADGYRASVEDVPYEFQRGAHQMLRVRR